MFKKEKAFFEKLIRLMLKPFIPHKVLIAKIGLVLVLLIPFIGIYVPILNHIWVWVGPFSALVFICILYFDYLQKKDPEKMLELQKESDERQNRMEAMQVAYDEDKKRQKAMNAIYNRQMREKRQKEVLGFFMFWK